VCSWCLTAGGDFGARAEAQLGPNVVGVAVGGLLADHQRLRNFTTGVPTRNERGDLRFAG
jgi:hypothetical protein